MASPGNRHCVNCIGTLSFPAQHRRVKAVSIGADFRFEVATGAKFSWIIGGGRGQWWGGHHGECRARAYNGGLGAEPPAGSRGRAPGQGVRVAKPPEAERILVIGCPTEPANLAPFLKCLALQGMV